MRTNRLSLILRSLKRPSSNIPYLSLPLTKALLSSSNALQVRSSLIQFLQGSPSTIPILLSRFPLSCFHASPLPSLFSIILAQHSISLSFAVPPLSPRHHSSHHPPSWKSSSPSLTSFKMSLTLSEVTFLTSHRLW